MGERGRRVTDATAWLRGRVPDDGAGWWAWWAGSMVALVSVPAAWYVLVFRVASHCDALDVTASYAGDRQRFADRFADCTVTSLGPFHRHIAIGYAVAAYTAVVLVGLWILWWRRAWITRRFVAAAPVVYLAPFAAAIDVVENALQHAAVGLAGTPPRPTIDQWAARLLPVLAWVKAIGYVTVVAATLCTLLAAFSRRRLRLVPADGEDRPTQVPAGIGICLSGGGIRAASISLGALGELERTTPDGTAVTAIDGTQGILDRARFLASVSGGGYAAGAWRIARGTAPVEPSAFAQAWPGGIIGSPDTYEDLPSVAFDSELPSGPPSLFRHLQQRREFLRTGRGGLSGSLVVAAAFLLVHLGVLLGLVTAIAWPVGRLADTWYVYRDGAQDAVGQAGRQFHPGWSLFGPSVVFAAAALALWLVTLVKWNTRWRVRMRSGARSLAFVAAALGLLLVGIPAWLDVAYPWMRAHRTVSALTGLVSGGGAVATVFTLMRKVLGPRLARLGGVLLAVVMVLYGTVVAARAALDTGLFGTALVRLETRGWLLLVAALAIGYFVLCPRWWSLHTLYRNRLRGSFATTRQRDRSPRRLATAPPSDDGQEPLFPVKQRHEPQLAAYGDAPGPEHLVCCSAARPHRTGTGVKALSFVLSGREAVFYDVDPPSSDGRVRVAAQGRPLPVKAFRAPITPWLDALGSRWASQAEGTVSAAISVSGAAVAPALGRMDMGSTNALLAALNLRLGTWFPNPRYVRPAADGGRVRFPWVRLSYMFKELFGFYDLVDHHLYVTDGGHRENLGLVELLRRRCRTIVCVDASGDTPGSYATLRQAVDLARLEVGADVDLAPLRARTTRFSRSGAPGTSGWPDGPIDGALHLSAARMTALDTERPPTAHTLLTVTYRAPDGTVEGTGTIVHLAPVLFEQLDEQLVAYALEDPLFPHYSTGDQFLTELQFRRLVQFGRCATARALADAPVVDELQAAVATGP